MILLFPVSENRKLFFHVRHILAVHDKTIENSFNIAANRFYLRFGNFRLAEETKHFIELMLGGKYPCLLVQVQLMFLVVSFEYDAHEE